MNIKDLHHKKVVIWGTGREAISAARWLRDRVPGVAFTFIDENEQAELPKLLISERLVCDKEGFEEELKRADVVIKSPGVSLYHPLLVREKARGLIVTSLLNLWADFAQKKMRLIGVTGTKGKSTTSSLLVHVLNKLKQPSALLGNIGVPVTEGSVARCRFGVVEVSSYQAANFDGMFDLGILVSLYPEHINWHRTLSQYYTDKAKLLTHSKIKLCENEARKTLVQNGIATEGLAIFDDNEHFFFRHDEVWKGETRLGTLDNDYLLRIHNRHNVCAVLGVIDALELDLAAAIAAMQDYQGLAHRQQVLGEKDGVLYVNDSLSTTPQSAIAAMQVYEGRPITLLVGGKNRGVDYAPLLAYLTSHDQVRVLCMGEVGQLLHEALALKENVRTAYVPSMAQAVAQAKAITPKGGVVLLSPAAPSYDMFRDYSEKAKVFAQEAGLDAVF